MCSGAEPALPFAPEHIQFLHEAMLAVTNGGGTASGGAANLGLGPILMAGKTGTAQSHGYSGGIGAHGAQGAWAERDHAWFIAFAPADDPRYAMAVLTEHGGFGAEASAPKAREIMRVALLKDPEVRARIVQPTPNVTAQPAAAAPPSAPAGIANPPAAASPAAATGPAAPTAAAASPTSAAAHAATPHHASAHAARAAAPGPSTASTPTAAPPASAPAPTSPPASDVPL
jgi:penicillin-binding protein 2